MEEEPNRIFKDKLENIEITSEMLKLNYLSRRRMLHQGFHKSLLKKKEQIKKSVYYLLKDTKQKAKLLNSCFDSPMGSMCANRNFEE